MNKTKILEQSRLMQQVLMLTMNKKITDLEVECKETEKQLIKAKEQNIEYQSQIDLKNTKIANIRKQLEQDYSKHLVKFLYVRCHSLNPI